jgi:hypothetical protein
VKPILDDPLANTPDQTEWPPAVVRRLAERVAVPAPQRLALCAECRYAQLFAQQPRARCVCPASRSRGQIVFAGHPSCASMIARHEDDLSLAWCTPGIKVMHHRFGRARRPK